MLQSISPQHGASGFMHPPLPSILHTIVVVVVVVVVGVRAFGLHTGAEFARPPVLHSISLQHDVSGFTHPPSPSILHTVVFVNFVVGMRAFGVHTGAEYAPPPVLHSISPQ